MTDRKIYNQAYRICTDAENELYDKVSMWTDASDVDTNLSSTTVSLDKQLTFIDMGTVPVGGGNLTKTYASTNGLLTQDGILEVYVDDDHSRYIPSSITRDATTLTLTFPSSAAGSQVKVRCWK